MMVSLLKLLALDVLHNPSLAEKIESGLVIGEVAGLIEENDTFDGQALEALVTERRSVFERIRAKEYVEIIPELPARESSWSYDPEKEAKWKKLDDREEWLFRIVDAAVFDVEINAMENSAALFLLGQALPLSFYRDFGSHISDEARHAQELLAQLKEFPRFQSERTYSHRVWRKVSGARNLLERIMIENVIEEGWAADRTVELIQEIERLNRADLATAFRKINDDEMRHSRIGIKWATWLLEGDEEKFLSLFHAITETQPKSRRISSIKTRLASGFSKTFIKKYF